MVKVNHNRRTQKIRAQYILLLIMLVLFTGSLTFGAETNDGLQLAPINPQLFIGKSQNPSVQTDTPDGLLQWIPSKETNHRVTGYRPPLFASTMSENHMTESELKYFSSLSLPASYDLRKTGKVTSVKAQGDSGSCWTFSTYGSMESCLLPTENRDFSENNLKNTHGFDRGQSEGGNFEMAMAYLTRWSGPINEVDDPYDDSSSDSPASSTLTVQKHIQEVLHLSDRSKDQIKNAIMEYGGVSTAMCWDPEIDTYYRSYSTYNETTHAYWDFISDDYKYYTRLNHAVTIVGWDDNYSPSNFKRCPGIKSKTATYPAGPPAGNGAWIVKNSWGTDWGEAGYFYVSYYDNNFARDVFVFANAEPVDNYQHRYDYDPYGNVENYGYSSPTAWMGNIFTAVANEGLTAVGTYAETSNAAYIIQIYTGISSNATSPKNGTLVLTQTGTFVKAGYHTVTLSQPIQLTDGEKFSVVIKITTPNYNSPIPVEARVVGIDDSEYDYSSKASSNPGESYVSKDGSSWTDIHYRQEIIQDNYNDPAILIDNFNVCIKAYTTNRPIITTQPTSQTVDAETNPTFTVGAFSMSQASYQWYYNDLPISGATSTTLSLSNVSPDNDGEYYVVVSNDWGTKVSNKATLKVHPLLPEPILDLKPGTYASSQNVSVFYPDGYTGLTLRYTTNGTDPTATSPLFGPTTPLTITKNTTLKVRAFLTGYTSSHVTTAIYTITGTIAKPTFDLPSGTITNNQIHLSCTTPGAEIYYTIDGSDPTVESLKYSGSITITASPTTIKAKAFLSGWDNSPTATATYYVSKIAPPTFSVAEGVYSTARSVTIKSNVIGATIYYTVDGTNPTPPSAEAPANGKKYATAIPITKDCMLKAVAYKSGLTASEIATANYYIGATPAPKFSLASGGTYNQGSTLTLSDTEPNALIYYTTDGSMPTDKSTLYEQPIQLTRNVTIKAKAYSPIRMSSAVVTATYNIMLSGHPEFSVSGGTNTTYTEEQTVAITYDDPGAVIRYTTNGTEPVVTSPAIASGQAVQVKGPSTTLKAKAFKTGWAPSVTLTATYKITTVGTVATPKLSPVGATPLPSLPYTIIVSCTTADAVIRYTDDGTTPNGLSPIVDSGIIPLAEPKTIKVRAFKAGMASSAMVSATYTSTLPTPTLQDTPTNGEQTVTILSTVGVTIRYTLDGTEPTATSRIAVDGQVLINKTMTLKAKAFKSGWVASKTLTQKFTISQVASPTFSVASGTYQKSQAVVVKCATVPATGKIILIHYTLDGTDPTATSSPTCTPGATITISTANAEKIVTLKAMAVGTGLTNSNMTTAAYRMTGTVAKPTLYVISKNILQASGTYASGLRVYAKCATEGAEIHYTTDGTTPTLTSPLMTGDYILVEKSCKLNVQAFKTDWLPSPVTSETYSILQVATPAITIIGTNATVSCDTPGSVIHYTTNGNDPIESDPVATPDVKIPLNEGITLKARAWKTGLIPSIVAVAKTQYTLTVTADANGSVTPAAPVTVSHGISTAITATPAPAYHFVKWEKAAGTGTVVFDHQNNANAMATVTGGDVTIRAVFAHDAYTLTVETDGNGSVTPAGALSVEYGSSTIIKAVPNTGYHFLSWVQTSGSGTAVFGNAHSANTTVSVTGGDATVRANYVTYNLLTIVDSSFGTTSPIGTVEINEGASLTLSATPKQGSEFVNWSKTEGTGTVKFADSNSPSTHVTLNGGNANIQANFTAPLNTWCEGIIRTGKSTWYCFKATVGTQYTIGWKEHSYDDSNNYTCEVVVSAYQKDKSTTYFSMDSCPENFPPTVTAREDYVFIEVKAEEYSSYPSGSFAIKIAPIYSAQDFKSVFVGQSHTLAIKHDGTVWGWGSNSYSQLANSNDTNFYSPVQINNISHVTTLACGLNYSLALKGDGTVWSWGTAYYGELGNGSTNSTSSTPLQISNLSNIIAISSAKYHNLALKDDGTVWAWGSNDYGKLGNGTTSSSSIPVQVSNLTDVVAIACGECHSMALKKDGTVWTWGKNGSGELGIGSSTYSSTVPVQVVNLNNVIAITSGNSYCFALKKDGTLWGWGSNYNGQLGIGNTTNSGIPVQVSTLSNVIAMSGGNYHSLALLSNGEVWSWGANGNGQLGDGTTTYRNIPVKVSGIANAVAVTAGYDRSFALMSDSTIEAWGYSINGALGYYSEYVNSSPVKITDPSLTTPPAPLPLLYNITVMNNDNGAVSPLGTIVIRQGVEESLTALPNAGCTFVNWEKISGSGIVNFSDQNAANTTINVTDGNASIQANFAVNHNVSYSINITTNGNGSTTPSDTQTVNNGVSTRIIATPDTGSRFVQWKKVSGNGSVIFADPNSADTNVTVTSGDATIQAVFAKVLPYDTSITDSVPEGGSVLYCFPSEALSNNQISWTASTYGSIKVSAFRTDLTTPYFSNETYSSRTITAKDNYVYIVVQRTSTSSNGSYTIKVSAPFNMLTMASTENGSESPSSGYIRNGVATQIKATPNAGCLFVNWTKTAGDGTVEFEDENSATTMVTVTGGDATIKANFIIDNTVLFPMTITNDGNGSTSPPGTIMVNNGVETNVSATPNPGYHFSDWYATGTGTVIFGDRYKANTTVKLISGAATIKAYFSLNRYTLTVANDMNGTTTPSGNVMVSHGVATTIKATPSAGCSFVNWTKVSGTGTVVFGDPSLAETTVTVADGDAVIQANFSVNSSLKYTLTITKNGPGTTNPSGSIPVTNGGDQTITATPSTNCGFLSWTKTAGTGRVEFVNPYSPNTTVRLFSGDATIQASFTQPFEMNTWNICTITSNESKWYRLKVISGKQYIIKWDSLYDGTYKYKADIVVSAYHTDLTSSYFEGNLYGYSYPCTITAEGEYVFIKVYAYEGGNFALRADPVS